jgi:hypothetical protein
MVGLKKLRPKKYVDPKNKIEKNCSKPKKADHSHSISLNGIAES